MSDYDHALILFNDGKAILLQETILEITNLIKNANKLNKSVPFMQVHKIDNAEIPLLINLNNVEIITVENGINLNGKEK